MIAKEKNGIEKKTERNTIKSTFQMTPCNRNLTFIFKNTLCMYSWREGNIEQTILNYNPIDS